MTQQMDRRFEIQLEDENLLAEELDIAMSYPNFEANPEEFRELFKEQMLCLLAACAEDEHGADPITFFPTAYTIFGQQFSEDGLRTIFPECHSLADFWQKYYPEYVSNNLDGFYKLEKLPNDDANEKIADDLKKLHNECVTKDAEKSKRRIAEASEPEMVQKYMENFNVLCRALKKINERENQPMTYPVLYSELSKYFQTFEVTLNANYMREHYGRSSFKKVFQDNKQTIFSARLNYHESPGKNGVFSLSLKPGANEFTKEEISEAVAQAQQNKDSLQGVQKPPVREPRQYRPHEPKKVQETPRYEVDPEELAVMTGTKAYAQSKTTRVPTKKTSSNEVNQTKGVLYPLVKPQDVVVSSDEGSNYTIHSTDEENEEQPSSSTQRRKVLKKHKKNYAEEYDDRLPTDNSPLQDEQLWDNQVPLGDVVPAYQAPERSLTQYETQIQATTNVTRVAHSSEDFFQEHEGQEELFQRSATFVTPSMQQNLAPQLRNAFSEEQYPPPPVQGASGMHYPQPHVHEQPAPVFNPRAVSHQQQVIQHSASYSQSASTAYQMSSRPNSRTIVRGDARIQDQNIGQQLPIYSSTSRPGSVSGGSTRAPPRLGSTNGAFQRVSGKRSITTQTENNWADDLQLTQFPKWTNNDKKTDYVNAIITIVRLHERNNQTVKLSNLPELLTSLCGKVVTPQDFLRETWFDVIALDCNGSYEHLVMEPTRKDDYYLSINDFD